MEFVLFQKTRVEKGKIVAGTIRNYLKATKLFLDMNFDLPLINWKRITKSLPIPKNSASDRAPSLLELRTLINYPDRRIKAIISQNRGTFKNLQTKQPTQFEPVAKRRQGGFIFYSSKVLSSDFLNLISSESIRF